MTDRSTREPNIQGKRRRRQSMTMTSARNCEKCVDGILTFRKLDKPGCWQIRKETWCSHCSDSGQPRFTRQTGLTGMKHSYSNQLVHSAFLGLHWVNEAPKL